MIRRIGENDAAAVHGIVEASPGYSTTEELIRARTAELAADDHYFTAVYEDDSGRVLGFAEAQEYTVLYGDRGWNVVALAVAPGYRGQGIGRQLMTAVEEHARAAGGRFVRLNSRIEREDAHAFYERLGYRTDKTQKRFIRELT